MAGGANKARQGGHLAVLSFRRLIFHPLGTDHQRIVKLDRENEVAPPPKVAPSVGRVRALLSLLCA